MSSTSGAACGAVGPTTQATALPASNADQTVTDLSRVDLEGGLLVIKAEQWGGPGLHRMSESKKFGPNDHPFLDLDQPQTCLRTKYMT
jgi:hypothetical protein